MFLYFNSSLGVMLDSLSYLVTSIWFLTNLWKESLNSEGQQFHQYQQNEQPPLSS
jgi:hypothetical protein